MIDTGTGLVICAIVYGLDRAWCLIRSEIRERRRRREPLE